ncbi:MAG: alpha/beta fold hydrolase [Cyclobacteriaceae bacterium]
MSFFKTEVGKQEIFDLYNEKLRELNIEYDYVNVETSIGTTNIIRSGDPENPPILLVHGSNGCAPIALETYPNLSTHYRVYAIDVPAQPNKSAETRMSMKDNSYGRWMNEIMEQLHIENARMIGFSFGGLIILKTLEYDESRIKEVYLAAPAYIVNGNPLQLLMKVFIPIRRYISTGKVKYVKKFLAELFTERDDFAVRFLAKVFRHYTMDFTPVPTISTGAAKSIKTPITLFAAKNDLMFPGAKMIRRASRIFPSLKRTTLLERSKHVQSKADNLTIESIVINHN